MIDTAHDSYLADFLPPFRRVRYRKLRRRSADQTPDAHGGRRGRGPECKSTPSSAHRERAYELLSLSSERESHAGEDLAVALQRPQQSTTYNMPGAMFIRKDNSKPVPEWDIQAKVIDGNGDD